MGLNNPVIFNLILPTTQWAGRAAMMASRRK
jgi:hypothetical protein